MSGGVVTVKFDLDLAKTAVATLLILSIIGIMFYYSQVKTGTTSVQPDRLVIVTPSELFVDKEATLTIKAVDSKGSLMESRQDVIEVSLTQRNASIGLRSGSEIIWSDKLNVRLERGTAEILLKGKNVETVTVLARQLNGETKLAEAITTLSIGNVG